MPITGPITAELVKAAALKAGVELDDGAYYEPAIPELGVPASADVLGVLILAEHPGFDFAVRLREPFFPRDAAALLGISESRAWGILDGFDGSEAYFRPCFDPAYDEGHHEGAACRADLIPDPGPLLAEV